MGLGAPKKRSKLATDPNNTTWSKSTTNFGHRILASQGWAPGQYLGASDAAHAEHYTAANASHIRVLLREDNLGIGAQVGGNGRAETFGLATLSGIFGRLNGKSEAEVERVQEGLRDAELRNWQGSKFGVVRFVYGGLLVGDKVEEMGKKIEGKRKRGLEDEGAAEGGKRKKNAEEGTVEAVDGSSGSSSSSSSEDEAERRAKKKAKKEKKRKAASNDDDEQSENTEEARRQRKEARRKARREAAGQDSSAEATASDEKARRKEEKRAHKEEKRKRKEEKRRLKSEKSSAATSATSTPATGGSTPLFGGSRHAVRQRYIQQKRLASMDPQALKEILMLKATG